MDPQNFSQNAPGSLQYHSDGYWTYLPYALPPLFRWSDRLVAALSSADRALAGLAHLVRRDEARFSHLIVLQEAVESCRLAGYDLDFTGFLLEEARFQHVPHQLSQPVIAVRRLAETIQAVCGGQDPWMLNQAGLQSAHAALWPGPVDMRWPPGEFRTGQTWIGTEEGGPQAAAFVPPPPGEMRQSLDALVEFIHQTRPLPDLIRLAMIHYQFIVIHPFYDANGRLVRLLTPWLLRSWRLLPGPWLATSPYFRRNKVDYFSIVEAVRRDNAWTEWFIFFLNGVQEQAASAMDSFRRMESLRASYHARLATERNAERLAYVADLILLHPYITVNQVRLAVQEGNFKSAARVVEKLEQKGILEEITGRVRHRLFRAVDVLAELERFEQRRASVPAR